MRKNIFILTVLIYSFLLASCPDPYTHFDNTNVDLEPGKGYLMLSVNGGLARTIVPGNPVPDSYDLVFTPISGGTALSVTRNNSDIGDPIILETGSYKLTITGKLGANVVAYGVVDSVAINSGVGSSRTVNLYAIGVNSPYQPGTPLQGTFSWNITHPASVTSAQMTIVPLNATGTPEHTVQIAGGGPVTLNVGYYNVFIELVIDADTKVKHYEVLHIYHNLESIMPAVNFDSAYFKSTKYTVTINYNDGGLTLNGTQTIVHGGNVTNPGNPTRTLSPVPAGLYLGNPSQYNFDGWKADSNFAGVMWDFDNYTVIGNMTLTAQWSIQGRIESVNANDAAAAIDYVNSHTGAYYLYVDTTNLTTPKTINANSNLTILGTTANATTSLIINSQLTVLSTSGLKLSNIIVSSGTSGNGIIVGSGGTLRLLDIARISTMDGTRINSGGSVYLSDSSSIQVLYLDANSSSVIPVNIVSGWTGNAPEYFNLGSAISLDDAKTVWTGKTIIANMDAAILAKFTNTTYTTIYFSYNYNAMRSNITSSHRLEIESGNGVLKNKPTVFVSKDGDPAAEYVSLTAALADINANAGTYVISIEENQTIPITAITRDITLKQNTAAKPVKISLIPAANGPMFTVANSGKLTIDGDIHLDNGPVITIHGDVYVTSNVQDSLILKGAAKVNCIALYASDANTHTSITLDSWTGTVSGLLLKGNNTNSDLTTAWWKNKTILKQADASDIAKFNNALYGFHTSDGQLTSIKPAYQIDSDGKLIVVNPTVRVDTYGGSQNEPFVDAAEAFRWIKAVNAGANYTIKVGANQSISSSITLETADSITLVSDSGTIREIEYTENQLMISVGNTANLTLGSGITLKGNNTGSYYLVSIYGKMTMLTGSKITGNTNSGQEGVVSLNNYSAELNMHGGEITGNSAGAANPNTVGGVRILNGKLTMTAGSSIKGNSNLYGAADVYVSGNATTIADLLGNAVSLSGDAEIGAILLDPITNTRDAGITLNSWSGVIEDVHLFGGNTVSAIQSSWKDRVIFKSVPALTDADITRLNGMLGKFWSSYDYNTNEPINTAYKLYLNNGNAVLRESGSPGFTFTLPTLSDGTPVITSGVTLSRTGDNVTTFNNAKFVVPNPANYKSIEWYFGDSMTKLTTGVGGTNNSELTVTVNGVYSTQRPYDILGPQKIIVEVITTAGAFYTAEITFTVVQ